MFIDHIDHVTPHTEYLLHVRRILIPILRNAIPIM